MTHYALLGGGRLARHLRPDFSLLNLPCSSWTRDGNPSLNSHAQSHPSERLRATVRPASHVLLLVSDAAIPEVVKRYPFLHEKILVHCSGALSFPGIAGAHPLMTFGPGLYDLDDYRRIPFMVESGHPFGDVLPGLPNLHFAIPVEEKARYHALCVMAGNFSQVLWQAVATRFAAMGFPAATLEPYLGRVLKNFLHDPGTALTGPLSRGDHQTIARNLSALSGDPLAPVYRAFVELHHANHPLVQQSVQQSGQQHGLQAQRHVGEVAS
jgi:predicted short-subunit dehydrogenase-like oxidoreductase (DUF2520 family)